MSGQRENKTERETNLDFELGVFQSSQILLPPNRLRLRLSLFTLMPMPRQITASYRDMQALQVTHSLHMLFQYTGKYLLCRGGQKYLISIKNYSAQSINPNTRRLSLVIFFSFLPYIPPAHTLQDRSGGNKLVT